MDRQRFLFCRDELCSSETYRFYFGGRTQFVLTEQEDEVTPDEIEAMRIGREEIRRGEIVSHDDIDWD